MSRKFYLLYIALAIILTGCINYWKKDVSNNEIFIGIINTQHNLLRSMVIVKEKGLHYYDMVDIESKHYKMSLDDVKIKPDSFEIIHVDKGTPIIIESIIKKRMDQRFTILTVAGKIYSKEKMDWVKFEYIWANTGIRRTAPWESKVDEQALKEIIDN